MKRAYTRFIIELQTDWSMSQGMCPNLFDQYETFVNMSDILCIFENSI